MQQSPDVRVIRIMCRGRIDPPWIAEALLRGAFAVLVAGCRLGECHYSTGNQVAEVRMGMVARALAFAGVHPGRLSVQWMSSAEGTRFVQVTTALIEQARQLGPLGQAEEKDPAILKRRLTAVRRALEGKKLRWVVGKALEFQRQGNLYGEIFTQHELNRCFDEIILDECTLQEISLILEAGPLPAKPLAERLEQPPPKVLRHLADMRRMGWVEVGRPNGGSPCWSLAKEPEERDEDVGKPLALTSNLLRIGVST